MQKLIIGLIGRIGSGKGAASDYLVEKYGAKKHTYSQFLRDVLDRIHIEQTREHIATLSLSLREAFGQDLFAKVVAEDLKGATEEILVLDGVRRPEDIEYVKDLPGFVLVHVDASEDTRLARVQSRGQNADDAEKTKESFAKDRQLETEQTLDKAISLATQTVDNNGTLEALHAQLDTLVTKFQ